MLNWITNLFKSKKEKFPREIETRSGTITQTSPHGYLVGDYKPLKPKSLPSGVGVISPQIFDYLNKPEHERVAKASPHFNMENNMNTEQLQLQLMQAVSYHFDKDAIRPGVVTSTLRNGKVYASVVRYGKQFSGGKKVVCKAQGAELKDVLTNLSVEFLNVVTEKQSPVDTLKQLVSDKKKDK